MRLKAGVACAVTLAFGLLLGGAAAARADGVDPSFPDPSFFSTPVTYGFAQPIGMAIAPEGRMFITDNAGIVWTSMGGEVKATPLFDLRDHVNEKQDRGLVGIAVDKNYAFTHYLYLAYTFEDRSEAELDANPSLAELPKTQRLVRVTVPNIIPSAAIHLEPDDEQVILGSYSSSGSRPGAPFSTSHACPQPSDLVNGNWSTANETDCIPSDSIEHTIDTVRVDPDDGTLWVSVGDGANGGSALDPFSWRSQRNESYSGKLLHVDTDGEGLEGHPFCPSEDDLSKVCTKVYAKGFRNPFRFFFRPSPDGRLTVADAGWSTREELDLAESGKNYGWPCREGTGPTPTWSERSECTAISPSAFSEPIYDYHQLSGGAILGGVSYEGTGAATDYPDEYKGAIFFSDYISNQVLYLRLNSAGTAVASGYPKVFADDLQAVDWATAANGDLMYVDIGFGPSEFAQIRQISADSDSVPPHAVISADKTFGALPLQVEFDASKSSDADGDELTYSWDFDEDGEADVTSNEPEAEWTFEDPVNTVVTLTVDDGTGRHDTDSIEIFAGDEHAPDPSFNSGPTTYRDGEPIVITGSATDQDEGSLALAHLFWNVKLDHAGTHIHPITEKGGVGSIGFTTDTAHDAPSTYIVEITATDSRGLSTTEKRVLTPITSLVRIDSSPQGATIGYGGIEHVAPYEKQSTIGVVSTLSAPSSLILAGSPFLFEGWSDGGAPIHDLVVPDHAVTVTARYRRSGGTGDGGDDGPKHHAAPLISFDRKRGLIRRRLLKGAVEDPDGIRQLKVGLRLAKKEHGHCLWWLRSRGGFAQRPGSCARPAFMPAALKGKGERRQWLLSLKGKLQAGDYLLVFRVVDGTGKVIGPRAIGPIALHVH